MSFQKVFFFEVIFLFLFLVSCKKDKQKTSPEPVKLPVQYTLSATDKAYNYLTDTIKVWLNRKRVNPFTNLVVPGDSVKVYYNPGLDASAQTDVNTLKIVLNDGEFVLKEYNCRCVSTDTFVIR